MCSFTHSFIHSLLCRLVSCFKDTKNNESNRRWASIMICDRVRTRVNVLWAFSLFSLSAFNIHVYRAGKSLLLDNSMLITWFASIKSWCRQFSALGWKFSSLNTIDIIFFYSNFSLKLYKCMHAVCLTNHKWTSPKTFAKQIGGFDSKAQYLCIHSEMNVKRQAAIELCNNEHWKR